MRVNGEHPVTGPALARVLHVARKCKAAVALRSKPRHEVHPRCCPVGPLALRGLRGGIKGGNRGVLEIYE